MSVGRLLLRASGLALAVLVATSGCGSSGNPSTGGSAGDAGLDSALPDGAADSSQLPDGSDAAGMDAATDHAANDAANDGSSSGDGSGADAACKGQLIFLAQAGTTSACSFPVPSSVDHNQVNVLLGGRLCEQGSNNCSSKAATRRASRQERSARVAAASAPPATRSVRPRA